MVGEDLTAVAPMGIFCQCCNGLPIDPIICGKDAVDEAALQDPVVTTVAVPSMAVLVEVDFIIGNFAMVGDVGSSNGSGDS